MHLQYLSVRAFPWAESMQSICVSQAHGSGGFQALMPLVGYFGGRFFADKVTRYSHWVAFVLLVFIGAGMIKESKEEEHVNADMDIKSMFILAVATSIDALAVGVTFAFLKVEIVSAVSFYRCDHLCLFSSRGKDSSLFGMKYKSKAELCGGIILILIGTKILLEGLGMI